jgi:hypothetical protein
MTAVAAPQLDLDVSRLLVERAHLERKPLVAVAVIALHGVLLTLGIGHEFRCDEVINSCRMRAFKDKCFSLHDESITDELAAPSKGKP